MDRAGVPSPPWPRRIGTRLTALVAFTTLGTFTLAVLLALDAQERYLIAEAVDGATLFGDSVVRATYDQMLRARKDEAYRVMSEIGGLERIEKVRLFNKEGKVTFSTNRAEIGTTPPATGASDAERWRITRVGDHRVLGFATPIRNERACVASGCHGSVEAEPVLGVVDVGVSLAGVDRELTTLRWKSLGVGLLVTVLLTSLILHATRTFILKPVKKLVEATREIARGHLDEPVRYASGDELGTLASSFDGMRVSLKKAHEDLERLMASLEQQVEERTEALKRAQVQLIQGEKLASLGKLSASIAHEINNPLAGILTFSKLIARDLEQAEIGPGAREEMVNRLKLVQRETERCSAIVRNLLDFARQRPPDLRDVDVRSAVEESLHLVAHQIQLAGHTLETELDGRPMVRADFGQLRQAIVNILLNAVEATPRGGTIRVSTSIDPKREEVVVAVTDTGTGIDPEHLEHIFDPFFTTKEKGTGLGLSVVYGILSNLGGKLEVESRKGEGTTARIRLPLVAQGATAA